MKIIIPFSLPLPRFIASLIASRFSSPLEILKKSRHDSENRIDPLPPIHP